MRKQDGTLPDRVGAYWHDRNESRRMWHLVAALTALGYRPNGRALLLRTTNGRLAHFMGGEAAPYLQLAPDAFSEAVVDAMFVRPNQTMDYAPVNVRLTHAARGDELEVELGAQIAGRLEVDEGRVIELFASSNSHDVEMENGISDVNGLGSGLSAADQLLRWLVDFSMPAYWGQLCVRPVLPPSMLLLSDDCHDFHGLTFSHQVVQMDPAQYLAVAQWLTLEPVHRGVRIAIRQSDEHIDLHVIQQLIRNTFVPLNDLGV